MPEQQPGLRHEEPSQAPIRVEEGAPAKKRWRWVALLLAILVIVAALVGYRIFHLQPAKTKSAAAPPVMITTATAEKGDIAVYVDAIGIVTPMNTVAVRSRVDGQLVKIFYEEGQMVHQGDQLAQIDDAPFRAAVAQAEGQLARDTALLENSRLDVGRYKEALARNAVPRQQYDTQLSTVHQYEGAVKLDEGQLENARVQLAYTRIAAPITGRVGLRLVDPGNIVHANDTNPLVIVTQLEPITVVFTVAEDVLPSIQQQLRPPDKLAVDVFDRARAKKIASGSLETLDNQIDPSTGTIKLKASFPNKDGALFPNQFVNARLLLDTHRGVALLPGATIQRNSERAFVYLLKPDQTITAHPARVGVSEGNLSEVEGVEIGAVVAADNFNRLTEGAHVAIRQTAPGGAKGKAAR
jgi:multidrug efflux system membrane fusion protein